MGNLKELERRKRGDKIVAKQYLCMKFSENEKAKKRNKK